MINLIAGAAGLAGYLFFLRFIIIDTMKQQMSSLGKFISIVILALLIGFIFGLPSILLLMQ